jgi:fructose-1,6-bisphosphatase/inositol monophosphatase family enzyme
MKEAAARALLPRFRKLAHHEREEKSAGEVVTVADRDCEAMLSEALSCLLPDASIVGEEAVHATPGLIKHLGDDLCWVIDPLDGTGYFAAGQEPFGIMITLASGGEAVGGWILEPLSGRFCWAAVGHGCWVDGRRMFGRESAGRAALGLSSLLKGRPQRFRAAMERLKPSFALQEIPRCAAAHYPAMLLGSPDLTLYERTLPWDHGAGILLLEEAGGRSARLDGSPYRLDDDRVGLLVAVNPALWEQAAGLLAELPE